VALLRAVNVGGHNQIKMTELKRMCESMGFGRVQTYIQSGNVLFESASADGETLRRRISEQISATFGLSVDVVVRTVAELERVVRDCPFAADALAEGESLYVALLASAPSAEAAGRVMAVDGSGDQCRVVGREVYFLYRQPSHKSKLTNALFEKQLGVAATTRNWQTLGRLVALGKAMA
jgi:uncharacterized protein (DUF1697 family)